jgi:hypothetical protein
MQAAEVLRAEYLEGTRLEDLREGANGALCVVAYRELLEPRLADQDSKRDHFWRLGKNRDFKPTASAASA